MLADPISPFSLHVYRYLALVKAYKHCMPIIKEFDILSILLVESLKCMSIEKILSSENVLSPEALEKQNEQIRKKHLEAMAVAMGANPLASSLSIEALFGAKNEFENIDHTKDRSELEPEIVEKIETIGKWFLFGSEQADQLKFPVGISVINLLKESPDSGYFTKLKDWVNVWTDGAGGSKFDEVLNRE